MITLREELESTLYFRKRKAEEYPDDNRNIKAQEIIRNLLDQDLSDTAQKTLEKAYEVVDITALERANDEFRAIGFHSFPSTLDEFASNVVEAMEH